MLVDAERRRGERLRALQVVRWMAHPFSVPVEPAESSPTARVQTPAGFWPWNAASASSGTRGEEVTPST